jgi:methionyl-tRNA formyltransferase
MPYSVAVAGSTAYTAQCGQALASDERFEVIWTLSPIPKPIGRKQVITRNPLDLWAETQSIPNFRVDRKIDAQLKETLGKAPQPDFLLVVDFGYLVPTWLLELPRRYPVNIHPSDLPAWRGSSPGQFVLLSGQTRSAVTIMIMNELLDQGPIIHQLPLEVQPNWTQTEYYTTSFAEVTEVLPDVLTKLAAGAITPQPQPLDSPTPIAGRLTKDDSFVDWSVISTLIGTTITRLPASQLDRTSHLLKQQISETTDWPTLIERAARAFHPWPGLWTFIPTAKGPKRMKLLSIRRTPFRLDQVQVEGQQPSTWSQVKSIIQEK